MNCPACGDEDAIEISLFTSNSYLCTNQSCRYFDFKHTVQVCEQLLKKTELPELPEPLKLPNDQGFFFEFDDIGFTD